MLGWYCVHAKSRSERIAELHLSRQGIETYCPLAFSDRRQSRKREIECLFPGYLFIRLDTESGDWHQVRKTQGVIDLIRFGDYPARVPDGLIDALFSRESAEGIHEIHPDYRPGDKVRLTDGPFKLYSAVVQAKSSRDRITVLIEALGADRPVTLPYQSLQPA